MAPSPGVWIHADSLGIASAVELGQRRALSGNWTTGTIAERVRELQGWSVLKAYLMAKLSGRVELSPEAAVGATIDPSEHPGAAAERVQASRTLYQTANLLATRLLRDRAWQTTAPAPGGPETGFPVVAVVAIIATAAAVCVVAREAAVVIDRHLAREEDSARMLAADAAAQELVSMHTAREDDLGRQLPLDPATKAALDNLRVVQSKVAEKMERPLSSVLPLTEAPATVEAGVVWNWLAIGVAAGAVAAFFIKRKRNNGST